MNAQLMDDDDEDDDYDPIIDNVSSLPEP